MSTIERKMEIEGTRLTEEHIWQPVTYVPRHANGNAGHKDAEQGIIKHFTDTSVFVMFCKGRTVQGCDPETLVWG